MNLISWILTILTAWQKPVARWYAVGVGVLSLWTYVNSLWADLFARIDALVVPATGGALSFAPCGLVNYVFPLDTMLNLLVAYGGLRLVCAAVRIVKSWVPTVA